MIHRKEFRLANRPIGPEHPCYIIAELSANHGQEYGKAVELVHAAVEAGADAIKLQTYTPDTMTIDCDKEHFRIGPGTIWEGRTLYDLYGEAYTPWDWQPKLKALADELGIDLFSTPFDATAVDFLEEMDVPAHKVASFELVDIPLIRHVARTGKPMILSTGMATPDEIAEAIDAARGEGNDQLALLKCTSAYPASPAEANLRAIPTLAERFGVVSGLSDHTLSPAVPVAAVTLGASIVEKHFTLRRSDGGPDAPFSLEPHELAQLVENIRTAEAALGEAKLGQVASESASRVFRRSLFVVEDIAAGEELTGRNVRSIRPGNGLPPKHLDEVLGRRAKRNLSRGTPLSWGLIEEGQP
jgi:N-acetylneuraminate synthase